ncbi:MAG TPA: FG-GAP-like repeat-containing protein, partial [Vicinamibacteria bacterium]|nr:FG-GAP-like repeat-containing protein [Vicinamibacteria bacterium]
MTANYPQGLTTPSGAHSALLYLRLTSFGAGTASGWFDDLILAPTPVADLSITKTDGHESAVPGTQITYTIVASNAGPSPANPATVTDTVPGTITGVTWTCVAAGGATCTASGSGSISQGVNLPVGGSVTYTLAGTISPSATGTLSNTATVATPFGVVDPTPANNTSTDTDTLALMGGPLPGPLPLLPGNNWWNLDISAAPVDPNSANFITFIGGSTPGHPDFGGDVSLGSVKIYGFPYAVVSGTQAKKTVSFATAGESDGVDHSSGLSFPFYPIPDLAITQAHWIESGDPGNVDIRSTDDRHLLIVDADNKYLYELYNVFYDTGSAQWLAGSGAFFDLNKNHRRPETWTSADAAGLAILPGLVRYEEAFGAAEIGHAFRVTLLTTNGYVYPASHTAGSTVGALPMGARLRLKAGKDISSYTPEVQRIFRAMKKYGLIVADNGTSMYVSGTYDTRWDNGILNPAFGALTANDFEVVQLGFGVPTELKLAEFDGDRQTDLAVFQSSSGLWFIKQSSTGTTTSLGYGGSGYVPVPADYDGDGKADIAVYHPPTGLWFIRSSSTGTDSTTGFGGTGYAPVRGDFDGDGKADLAVFHDASGLWFIKYSSTGAVV